MALPRQKGISHRLGDIHFLGRDHRPEEGQSLFLTTTWLNPIISQLHSYIHTLFEGEQNPRYMVAENKKFILSESQK